VFNSFSKFLIEEFKVSNLPLIKLISAFLFESLEGTLSIFDFDVLSAEFAKFDNSLNFFILKLYLKKFYIINYCR